MKIEVSRCQRMPAKNNWYLSGSYTVEAAFVMSITLFTIAALLTGIFQIHSRVAGNFVLQEGLERLVYQEERDLDIDIEQEQRQKLVTFFWCGNSDLSMTRKGTHYTGHVETTIENSITVKEFNPERFLRILRAAGV